MKIHIVSACCKKKQETGCAVPAKDLYYGTSHLQVKEAVSTLRKRFPNDEIKWSIVSLKYGFVDENEVVLPYEDTKFSETTIHRVMEGLSEEDKKNFQNSMDSIIEDSDVVIVCMGDKHNALCNFPHKDGKNNVIVIGREYDYNGYKYVPVNDLCSILHASKTDIKGVATKILAKDIEWNMTRWDMRNILLKYDYYPGWY